MSRHALGDGVQTLAGIGATSLHVHVIVTPLAVALPPGLVAVEHQRPGPFQDVTCSRKLALLQCDDCVGLLWRIRAILPTTPNISTSVQTRFYIFKKVLKGKC